MYTLIEGISRQLELDEFDDADSYEGMPVLGDVNNPIQQKNEEQLISVLTATTVMNPRLLYPRRTCKILRPLALSQELVKILFGLKQLTENSMLSSTMRPGRSFHGHRKSNQSRSRGFSVSRLSMMKECFYTKLVAASVVIIRHLSWTTTRTAHTLPSQATKRFAYYLLSPLGKTCS